MTLRVPLEGRVVQLLDGGQLDVHTADLAAARAVEAQDVAQRAAGRQQWSARWEPCTVCVTTFGSSRP